MESDAVLQFQALGFDPELGLPWAVFSVGFLEFFGFFTPLKNMPACGLVTLSIHVCVYV